MLKRFSACWLTTRGRGWRRRRRRRRPPWFWFRNPSAFSVQKPRLPRVASACSSSCPSMRSSAAPLTSVRTAVPISIEIADGTELPFMNGKASSRPRVLSSMRHRCVRACVNWKTHSPNQPLKRLTDVNRIRWRNQTQWITFDTLACDYR